MLNQTTNKIQSLGFGYKKIDAIKHQLIINGAGKQQLTNYKRSLPKNIIYESLLNFNGSISKK